MRATRPGIRIGLLQIAAVGVVAVVALGLAVQGCGVLRTGPVPSPSGPGGLAAGTYTSTAFQPRLGITLPAGWRITSDSPDYFAVQPVTSDQAGVHLFSDPQPASQATTCQDEPEPSVSTLSLDLAAWIQARPGLTASQPRLITIDGYRGTEFDLAIASGWTTSCPFANGLPAVPLFVGRNAAYRWVIAGSERLTLAILDVGGRTVVVDVDAFDGSLMDALAPVARPIVRSVTFEVVTPSPGAGA